MVRIPNLCIFIFNEIDAGVVNHSGDVVSTAVAFLKFYSIFRLRRIAWNAVEIISCPPSPTCVDVAAYKFILHVYSSTTYVPPQICVSDIFS